MDRFACIEAFVTIIDAGSFRRAADRLHIGKPLVSRRLAQLEQALGVQLLQRTTRNLSLTGRGREFYARAVQILGDLEEAEQAVIDDDAALRGMIRIAAPLSFGVRHLSDALNRFLERHPGLELDLDLNDREVNLVEEGFDMAVRIGDLQDSSLLVRRLGAARFVTCANKTYLDARGTPAHPRELGQHVGLHYSNLGVQQAWRFRDPSGKPIDGTPQIRLRANNGDALRHAAISGLGIMRSPTFICSQDIVAGRLIRILQDFRHPAVGIHAVFPPGRLIPRRVRALVEYLARQFGDQPEWDRLMGIED